MSPPAEDPHADTRFIRLGPDPAAARLTTILVHGRDQDDATTRDLAARLALPDVAHILPVATDRSWYPGRYFDPLETLEPHLSSSLAAIDRAIAHAAAPDDHLVLAGFSQGACLIAEYVARAGPRPFHGAAILTGSLLGTRGAHPAPQIAPNLPMAFVSSRHDEWIPLEDALATADQFRQAGARASFTTLENQLHHIADEAVSQLRSLLRA